MLAVDRRLWQQVIQHVVAEGGHIIRPWFAQLEPVSLNHGLLEIGVPSKHEQTYCSQHATRLFTEAAQKATGRLIGVSFLTPNELEDADDVQRIDGETEVSAEPDFLSQLQSDYEFDTFVSGPCNRLAHAAAVAVSESPGKTYNPLFIHGSVGLGKTHLLHAVCRKVAMDNPNANIVLLSCETFVNDFIESIQSGKRNDFRYRYRHADVLAIDDIQFLAAQKQSQEEFFHTFNTLYQSQKQIILSSDRGPDEIKDLEDRLASRFHWGLVAQVDKPCYETRVAIVRKKAAQRQIALPDDVVCFIAGAIDSNTRELEGAISKVAMLAAVSDRKISLAVAEEAIGADPRATGQQISIEDILNVVTAHYNVRLADLQSKKRSRSIAQPRQICMYLARQLTRHSLEEVGGYFGGRDHSTVLHAVRNIDQLRKKDPQLQAAIDRMLQQLQSM